MKHISLADWIPFPDPQGRPLPPERKDVLCKLHTQVNDTGGVAIGYLRYAAGDKDCPFFVCSGIPGPWVVTHWCDCLPEEMEVPGWKIVKRIRVFSEPLPDEVQAGNFRSRVAGERTQIDTRPPC